MCGCKVHHNRTAICNCDCPEHDKTEKTREAARRLILRGGIAADGKNQIWETAHGDLVTVWQAAPLGSPMDWHWHVQAKNGEIVEGGEGYPRRSLAREAALRHHPVYRDGRPIDDPNSEVVEEKPPLICFFDGHRCIDNQRPETKL